MPPVINTPQNPHDNTSPVVLTQDNYADPFELATVVNAREGVPQDILDQVWTDCRKMTKDSWLGFLDMFQMTMPVTTDFVQFVETTSPDYVVDDDGAVTRAGNDFTIDWSLVEGYTVGEDAFFYRVNDVVAVYDDTGKKELGVITAIDKSNNTFTALCRNGANWTVALTNLTIDVNGSDFDKGSCGPEGLMQHRKTKSKILKLQTVKDAMESKGGERYSFCFSSGEVMWYEENSVELHRRLNEKVAKTLMNDIESVDGSGAHGVGKYGTEGLFQNIKENGIDISGYLETVADMEALTTYYDSLGFNGDKEFVIHCNTIQYRFLEKIAVARGVDLGVTVNIEYDGGSTQNMSNFGFKSVTIDGYVFHFSKWGLTDGNSPFGKKRITEAQPKAIIMPMGEVPTMVNGKEMNVPYIFKLYQTFPEHGQNSMVRTFLTGAFAPTPTNDCEYEKITKSTTVAIAVVCPEAIAIVS